MNDKVDRSIPKYGFGLCRWCGQENQRLQYLMCSKCFRIANMMPSKTMVLLNRPDVKKQLGAEGATIRNITPELRRFLSDPQTRFLPEHNDRKHWEGMLEEAADHVAPKDVRAFLEEVVSRGDRDLPSSDDELLALVGMEIILRFVLHVSVIRGLLKLDIDVGEDEFFDELCQDCMEEAILDDPTQGILREKSAPENHASEPKAGMKVRDLIIKKYGR